ncbi:NADP-dependent oxidoreductase [Dellaglioa sp. L3N]
MKAAKINQYSKEIKAEVTNIPVPTINENEVLIKVKTAAVNPLELLIMTGSVKLIQAYKFPLTIGNELTGTIESVGANVTNFKPGDAVYSRLPLEKIGAIAEYAAVASNAIAPLPTNLDFDHGAAAPLTGLTAYQGLHEELDAQPGETLFIPGGSGSFGQMAIPIAKAAGLTVIVSGGSRSKEATLAIGADQYLDYKTEDYWKVLSNVDYVIDTLGPNEFEHELAIIKPGGRLLSLVSGPNKRFAVDRNLPYWKQLLFTLAGAKLDRLAKAKDVEYHFIFVRSDAEQLRELTKIIETNNIVPQVDPTVFSIDAINEALQLVSSGHPTGKVLIKF